MSTIAYSFKEPNNKKKNNNTFIMDDRLVTIYEYNPEKKYDISIYKFVDILNEIEISKNTLDICNSIKCNNLEIRQKTLDFALTYKNIFNGDNNSYNARKVLEIINCDIRPKVNSKTYKSISYVKWKIFEINQQNHKNSSYNNEDNISEWIGVLSGLVLYFDELDQINYNNTRYSIEVCKPLTVNDI